MYFYIPKAYAATAFALALKIEAGPATPPPTAISPFKTKLQVFLENKEERGIFPAGKRVGHSVWAGRPSPKNNTCIKEFVMPHPVLEVDECIGCGICVDACPQGVLEIAGGVVVVENEDACIACGDCVEECPMGCITEISED